MKTEYERIKEKIKDIRQGYRKAVTEGRRSGSGKLVCDNWDTLKALRGGSLVTTQTNNILSFESYSQGSEEKAEKEAESEETVPVDISVNTSSASSDPIAISGECKRQRDRGVARKFDDKKRVPPIWKFTEKFSL